MQTEMKLVQAYKTHEKILIRAGSQTTVGVWISNGCAYVSTLSDANDLTSKLKLALRHSNTKTPDFASHISAITGTSPVMASG